MTRRLIAHVADDETAHRRRRARAQLEALSDREREVAVAIGEGRGNAEIARALHMSLPTVKDRKSVV